MLVTETAWGKRIKTDVLILGTGASGVGAEHRHEMVVAAAEAAGAFQPPLPHHEHVGLKFRRAQGCTDT